MFVYLAYKDTWRNKGRFFLVSLVIALITLLVLFIAARAEGLGLGNREYIEKLDAELVLYQENVDFSIPSSRIGWSTLNDIKRIDGVSAVGPIGFASTTILLEGAAPLGASLIGVEPGQPGQPPAFEGSNLRSRRAKEAIIDKNVVLRTGLGLGDRFTIKTIQGTQEKFFTLQVAGISDGRRYSIQPSIFVPFLTWDEVRPKASLEAGDEELIFNVVAVRLDREVNPEEMKQRLTAALGGLEAADLVTAYESTPGYGPQQSTLNTQRIFTLLIGILVIGGFFQIQTLQKVAQIGMLKAIGASNLTVALAALAQIVLVTILGVMIGAAGTLALAAVLPAVIPIIFTPTSVVAAMVTLMIIGPVGGLVSVRVMLKVEPLNALGLAA